MQRPILLLTLCLVVGCTGTRKLVDPVLRINTAGGSELGASTIYGVVFLGRTATSGYDYGFPQPEWRDGHDEGDGD